MSRRKGTLFTTKYRGDGYFIPLMTRVFRSDEYTQLSSHAVKLLIDLMSMSNGKNNGDLSASFTVMKKHGWTSSSNLWKARQELIKCGFIVQTRQGGRNNTSLYALTFFAIDECNGKLDADVNPTITPRDNWKIIKPFDIKSAQRKKIRNDAQKEIDNAKNQLNNVKKKSEITFYYSQIERAQHVINQNQG